MDTPEFPSHAHRNALRSRAYSTLIKEEKEFYHAYNYAWQRHFMNNTDGYYAMDPRGERYNGRLADRARRMLWPRREHRPRNTVLHPLPASSPPGGKWRSIAELLGVRAVEEPR